MGFSQYSTITSGVPQNNGQFGYSVSIDGFYIATGEPFRDPGNSGRAQVIRRDTDDLWQIIENLEPTGGVGVGDQFGYSVDIDSNYVIVGSPGYNGNRGRATVFVKDSPGGDDWIVCETLSPGDLPSNAFFGCSVSIVKDYLIVGARADNDNGLNSGSSYIYKKVSGNNWSLVKKITASDGDSNDFFGRSVGIYGDYAVVGAYADDDNGYQSGSAYVFYKDYNGDIDSWGQSQKILPLKGQNNAFFGNAVSIYGDYIAVGAFRKDSDYTNEGAVYLFKRYGSSWIQSNILYPYNDLNDHSGYLFGTSVDLKERYLIVGYPGNNSSRGAADVFCRKNDWQFVSKITDSGSSAGDNFGFSVGVSNNYICCGAPEYDGSGTDTGSVIIYEDTNPVLRLAQKFIVNTAASPSKASVYLKRIGENSGNSFILNNDEVVIDATNFKSIDQSDNKIILDSEISGFTGNGYMIVSLDLALNGIDDSDFPILNYPICASDAGKYYLWIRVLPDVDDKTFLCDVFIDNEYITTISSETHIVSGYEWFWAYTSIVLPDTNIHTLGLKIKGRESAIDKIYIDKNYSYPYSYGPNYTESPFFTTHMKLAKETSSGVPGEYLYIYDYKNSIEDMGLDDWQNFDIDILDSRKSITVSSDMRDKTNETFERDSIAFIDNETELEQVGNNTQRKRTVAVASKSDGVLRNQETIIGETNNPIRVICTTSQYIWGHNSTTQKIYRSLDGDTWESVDNSTTTCHLFTTSTGRLLRWESAGVILYRGINKTWYSVFYCDNPDEAIPVWTQCVDGAGFYYFGALPTDWGVAERNNGTIIAVEYGSIATYEGYINRSVDDGTTWNVVHTQAAGTISHYHAVGYHSGQDTWICNTGDGDGKRLFLTSTDDGQTWNNFYGIHYLEDKQDNANQVTRYLDYGHPTRILCGSDSFGQVHWLDITTFDVGQLITTWENEVRVDPLADKGRTNYCFLMFKYNDVYYACQMDNGSVGYAQSVISVSTDLEHWTVYHRINNSDFAGGRHFAGFFNGKLHIAVSNRTMDVYRHLIISPATVYNTRGLLIEPSATSQCTEEESSAETGNIGDWNDAGSAPLVKEFSTGTSYHGDRSVHVSGGALTFNSIRRNIATTVGKYYVGRVYVKGYSGESWIYIYNTDSDIRHKFLLNTDEWKPYTTNVYQADAAARWFTMTFFDRNTDDAKEAWIDALAMYEFPCPFWHIGGSTKAKDEYQYKIQAGQYSIIMNNDDDDEVDDNTNWQDEFAFHPHIGAYLIVSYTGKMYVRTYKSDNDNYASVYYKADEKKFYLEVYNNGEKNGEVSTDVTSFIEDSTIWIKVVKSSNNIKLMVASGEAYISSSTTSAPSDFFGEMSIISGDINGDYLFPHTLSVDLKSISSYYLVMSISGNRSDNFILWELIENDEYTMLPSAIRI